MENFGKIGKDKITNYEGIIIGKINWMFGCAQYGIASQTLNKETGKRPDTEWFDEGRIEIMGKGIEVSSVLADKPGADHSFDTPKG